MNNVSTILQQSMNTTITASSSSSSPSLPLQWMITILQFRTHVFEFYFEPCIVHMLGPVEIETTNDDMDSAVLISNHDNTLPTTMMMSSFNNSHNTTTYLNGVHRRLNFLPNYVSDITSLSKETSMSFITLIVLFVSMVTLSFIFLSCFYHNQKTSPLFISPRKHRLPNLVPPALPIDGYFAWIKICFYISDEEIIHRIGYDSLIFLRFHRLALRCIVKMSVFSFIVLLPLNFTGEGHANAFDIKEYVGSLFFTDFLLFTMANVQMGSPRLWVHCFAAYLLTAIVIRELLREYETFHNIRHRYLLSKEPHLRTVLVTNIPRHLRSSHKIESYFRNVYPNAVKNVILCQNLVRLEDLVDRRTAILSSIEQELLLLCRSEKKKLYEPILVKQMLSSIGHIYDRCCSCCGSNTGSMIPYPLSIQERLAKLYEQLEQHNIQIEQEQRRRKRVMIMLDRMSAGKDGIHDIDYVLAAPFVTNNVSNDERRILGLPPIVPEHHEVQQSSSNSNNNVNDYISPVSGGEIYGNDDDNVETTGASNDEIGENTFNQLRSRSPLNPVDSTVPPPHQSDKKKLKAYNKARKAIKRYGKFNPDSSFLGKPMLATTTTDVSTDGGTIEDHINEVTDKAFVVMRTFTAATIAIQSMHSSKPGAMQVTTAPEPRDLLWNNIYMSKGAHRTRSYLGEFLVLLIITFYVVPMAMVSLLVSESALISSSPRLAQLAQASAFFAAAISLVQPLFIVGLQQLLPPLFMAIGRAEGITSFSEVQMRTFSRYFLFQVINVFLVTTIAGSIFDAIALIVEKPESAFEMLGTSLPRLSAFFITFVTVKTFLGLGFELVRIMSLIQATARFLLFPNATLRQKRTPLASMRAIDDPGWFPFHKVLAQDMLVVVISVVFAVVAPLVTLPCALFCLCSRIVWTHQHLYVYESVFESGGQFWPKIFRRFVFGLIVAQMTITGQFILKDARHEAYATIALMFLTYFFLRATRSRFDPTSSALPLEVATVMDISLRQDEAAEMASSEWRRRQLEALSGATFPDQQHSYRPDAGSAPYATVDNNDENGNLIGRYDPFENAYVQPALRANPRARPEQPFPVAQLGPDDTYYRPDSGESISTQASSWHDSRATVRLKSMNQQDRRLINAWWNDQLQRAGDQNVFAILIGEECGTLTISGLQNGEVELNHQPSMSDTHSFV
jgi:Calcium-dependent channel, 7TM region, putative phosphate/Late exocytosis, associated with Golgi transport/Cytosolic domain of 10TM putative phosphate transporter